jgi:hypothetical protein
MTFFKGVACVHNKAQTNLCCNTDTIVLTECVIYLKLLYTYYMKGNLLKYTDIYLNAYLINRYLGFQKIKSALN